MRELKELGVRLPATSEEVSGVSSHDECGDCECYPECECECGECVEPGCMSFTG